MAQPAKKHVFIAHDDRPDWIQLVSEYVGCFPNTPHTEYCVNPSASGIMTQKILDDSSTVEAGEAVLVIIGNPPFKDSDFRQLCAAFKDNIARF